MVVIENRRKKGWRRAGARYLRVGDKSARLNRGVKGGRSGTGGGTRGASEADGWTDAGQISRGCGGERERKRKKSGGEGGRRVRLSVGTDTAL